MTIVIYYSIEFSSRVGGYLEEEYKPSATGHISLRNTAGSDPGILRKLDVHSLMGRLPLERVEYYLSLSSLLTILHW